MKFLIILFLIVAIHTDLKAQHETLVIKIEGNVFLRRKKFLVDINKKDNLVKIVISYMIVFRQKSTQIQQSKSSEKY